MFVLSFYRIIKYGCQNFARNFWLSVVTVTIMVLSLLSISILGLVTVISNQALTNLEQKIDISVYLKPKLEEASIMMLKSEIEVIPGVKAVSYTSADQALVKFREKYQNNESIAEALILLGVNPLGASLNIKAYSEEGYEAILDNLEGERYADLIQEARFDDYRQVIAGINDLSVKVKNVGLGISLIFLIIALLVVFNTIRINIYSQREEIEIKRLVGATNWYIRAPFWVESVIYALLATVITAVIFYFSLGWIDPYIASLFNGYQFSLVEYFSTNGWYFFGSQFLGAALLNVFASFIAMRRYLKV